MRHPARPEVGPPSFETARIEDSAGANPEASVTQPPQPIELTNGRLAEAAESGEAAPVRECRHGADGGAGPSVVECAVGGELLLDEGLAAEDGAVGEMPDAAAQERGQRKFAAGGDDLLECLGCDAGGVFARGGSGAEEREAVARLRGGPIGFAAEREEAALRIGVAGDRFAVAAEAVVFGVVDEAGADRVEVDVGGDGFDGPSGGLDEEGFETLGPERAVAAVAFVKPNREALLKQFHELRDVAHKRELAFAPDIAFGAAGAQLCFDDVEPGGLELGGRGVKPAVAAEELSVRDGRALRHHQ